MSGGEIAPAVVQDLVKRALEEDRARADVTTRSIFGERQVLSGRIAICSKNGTRTVPWLPKLTFPSRVYR